MPKKTPSSIQYQDDLGNEIEEKLFTYSEQERQENEINKNNAQAIFTPEFIPVYRAEVLKYCLNEGEARLYGFLRFFFSLGKNQRFYFTNEQLSEALMVGTATVTRAVQGLGQKMGLRFGYKIKAGGGTYRVIDSRQIKMISQTNQIDQSHQSNRLANKNKLNKNKLIRNNPKGLQKPSVSDTQKGLDTVIAGTKPRRKGKNKSVDFVINRFMQTFEIPLLDGSQRENRRYAHLLLLKFGGEAKVAELIDRAAQDEFWSLKLTSLKVLYNHAVEIISKTRETGRRVAIIE